MTSKAPQLRPGPGNLVAGCDRQARRVADLARSIREDPSQAVSVEALADTARLGTTKLNALFRRHYHVTAAQFLSRARADAASVLLRDVGVTVDDAGFAAGYESVSSYHEQFRRHTCLTPAEYRRLGGSAEFTLRLPSDYSPVWALRVLGRRPAPGCEGVDGVNAFKVLRLPSGVGILHMEFGPGRAHCALRCSFTPAPADSYAAHGAALRLLGLPADPAPFERRAAARGEARLVGPRRGLRVPLTVDVWEAFAWSIIGQQVNLAFAAALRRDLVELCGDRAPDGLRAHPGPGTVALLDAGDLRRLRFSGRKAEYLIGAAQQIASGALSIAELAIAPAGSVEAALLALRGIGPWTARYVMMRGLGLADVAPIGDAALHLALQRHHGLEGRPDAAAATTLMEAFSPHRSLATFHLWQSLVEQG